MRERVLYIGLFLTFLKTLVVSMPTRSCKRPVVTGVILQMRPELCVTPSKTYGTLLHLVNLFTKRLLWLVVLSRFRT